MKIYTVIECDIDDAFEPVNFYCSNDYEEIIEEIEAHVTELPEAEQSGMRESTEPAIEALKTLFAGDDEVADGKYDLTEPFILLVTDI